MYSSFVTTALIKVHGTIEISGYNDNDDDDGLVGVENIMLNIK